MIIVGLRDLMVVVLIVSKTLSQMDIKQFLQLF
jgi:hypothetical protein